MDRGGILVALVVLGVAAVAVFLVASPPGGTDPVESPAEGCVDATAEYAVDRSGAYNRTTVLLRDGNGTDLATVDVRLADTDGLRYTGLSETDSLADGEGMLFVHEREDTYTYVMRRMAFPIDIVFVASEGQITRIHHAPVPEEIEGGNGRFPGEGRYVLEVPRGYTNRTGVGVGDCVVLPGGVEG
jgi:uncharacterized membrane protein (UPF0127 family)